MFKSNIILNTDSYKTSHYLQYPPQTEYVSHYIESRGGKFPGVLFFGLQMFIKDQLLRPITQDNIEQAAALCAAHGVPFNREGWEYILQEHAGYLPIQIEAVPEGEVVPVHQVLVQVMNTDPRCFWLTGYIETALLRAVWYPTTVATLSWHCRNIIQRYCEKTMGSLAGLEFKLHDFGARGVSSAESSYLGGLAHLINFKGTDTMLALVAGQHYYHEPMAGYSIPAAEHATITAWGKENEALAYATIIHQHAGQNKILAVVSDSYDLWNALDNIWGAELKSTVQEQGGVVVIRLDSGDPVHVVTSSIERLMSSYGYTINSKGYRELPPYLRVIQGDGVSSETIEAILAAMMKQGQSAANIAFGMGGELLQKVNRDTMKFAMKASSARIAGQWVDVSKNPVTDPNKRSKEGRLALIKENSIYKTIREEHLKGRVNLLQPVFKNGKLLIDWTLEQVRARPCKLG